MIWAAATRCGLVRCAGCTARADAVGWHGLSCGCTARHPATVWGPTLQVCSSARFRSSFIMPITIQVYAAQVVEHVQSWAR